MSAEERTIRAAIKAIQTATQQANNGTVRVLCDEAEKKLWLALSDVLNRGPAK